ncbi:MAG: cation transporter, partial [Chloroflexi bacterium]|nr:cation transporter [Chloroflexota bacterium]
MATTSYEAPESKSVEISVGISGMTCASCVRRVEKALGRVPGVEEAIVNLATEEARVRIAPGEVSLADLAAAVEQAGYHVVDRSTPSAPEQRSSLEDTHDAEETRRTQELAALRTKAFVSLAIGVVLMLAMELPLGWDVPLVAPLFLIAATIVQFWAGSLFYRSAWAALRHGSANMNTLVVAGTTAAYGYSAFLTLWPALAGQWGFPYHLYYEASTLIVALVLLGRWLEARARRQTGAAIRAL